MLAERVRALRNLCFGKRNRFEHEALGWNFRMSNLQAAVGVAQLEQLDDTIAKKRQIGRWYEELLGNVAAIERPPVAMPYAENMVGVRLRFNQCDPIRCPRGHKPTRCFGRRHPGRSSGPCTSSPSSTAWGCSSTTHIPLQSVSRDGGLSAERGCLDQSAGRTGGRRSQKGFVMNTHVEQIYDNDYRLLAMIVRASFDSPGITFFTPPEFSQQLGYMRHPLGKQIDPHIHKPVARQVVYTQETLIIKRGKLRVDFYDDQCCLLKNRTLEAGDVILLICGGHGFEVLEELEMLEVKQGPFAGDRDKERFVPATKPTAA